MKKIFIIEDDKFVSDMYARLFRTNGYDVVQSQSAAEALDMLGKNDGLPDLIILDIHMPEMSGTDFLKNIKHNDRIKGVPVVVLTNSFYEEDEKRFLDLGADLFLIKIKTSNQEILEKVGRLLERSHQ